MNDSAVSKDVQAITEKVMTIGPENWVEQNRTFLDSLLSPEDAQAQRETEQRLAATQKAREAQS